MFNNCGHKIKILAKISFWISFAMTIVAAIAVMSIGEEYIFIGLLIPAIGWIPAYISSLLLANFGEIAENTYEMSASLERLCAQNSHISAPRYTPPAPKKQAPVAQPSAAPVAPVAPIAPVQAKVEETPAAAVVPTDDQLVCPACGTVQRSNRKFCMHCGAKF